MSMLLSVIIPVYNTVAYLRRCVGGVTHQTYRDLEIILVDDGSTDGSGQLCDELAQTDNRIQVIHKSNGGLSDARNTGLNVASGEYVVFLDSDDEWLIPDGIEQMMIRMKERASDILLFKRVDIYPNRQTVMRDYDTDFIRLHSAQEVFERLMITEQFCMSACFQLLRREMLVKNHLHFPVGYISEDVDFSCHLWQVAQSVDGLNLNMYGYHHRMNSISTSYSIRSLRSYDWMFDYWGEQIAARCINYHAIGAFMANLYVSCSYSCFSVARNDRNEAKLILLKHQDLLNYAVSKKSLRMKKVVDRVGIRGGIFLFAVYGKLKKYYKTITKR